MDIKYKKSVQKKTCSTYIIVFHRKLESTVTGFKMAILYWARFQQFA